MAKTIKEILIERTGVDPKKITKDATPESMGMDSLDQVEFWMSIEDEYEITVEDEEATGFKKLEDVFKYLENHKIGPEKTGVINP